LGVNLSIDMDIGFSVTLLDMSVDLSVDLMSVDLLVDLSVDLGVILVFVGGAAGSGFPRYNSQSGDHQSMHSLFHGPAMW